MRKSVLTLLGPVLAGALALPAAGHAQNARAASQELLIQRVESDPGTLVIHGENFCADPEVLLAGAPLAVSAGDDTLLVVPAAIDPGDYLLVVNCGDKAATPKEPKKEFDVWNLTIADAAGPGGDGFPAPDFDSGWVSDTNRVTHDLAASFPNVLVDVQLRDSSGGVGTTDSGERSVGWYNYEAQLSVFGIVDSATQFRVRIWITPQ